MQLKVRSEGSLQPYIHELEKKKGQKSIEHLSQEIRKKNSKQKSIKPSYPLKGLS